MFNSSGAQAAKGARHFHKGRHEMNKAIALATLLTVTGLLVSARVDKNRGVEEVKRLNAQAPNVFTSLRRKVSETVVWAGKMPNAGKTSHLRFTGIWMRQDGRWREIARHANIIVEQ